MKVFYIILFWIPLGLIAQPIKYKKDWASDITDNAYAPKRIFVSAFACLPNLQASHWKYLESKADYNFKTKLFIGVKGDYAINKNWSAGLGYHLQRSEAIWAESYKDSLTQKIAFEDKYFSTINHTLIGTSQFHVFSNKRIDVFINGEIGIMLFKYAHSNVILTKPKAMYGLLGGGFRFFATRKLALQIIGGIGSTHNLDLGACWRLGL